MKVAKNTHATVPQRTAIVHPAPGLAVVRPHILYVVRTLQVGGSERHLLAVTSALVTLGWRISIFSLGGDGPLRAAFVRAGIEVVGWPLARLSGRLGPLARIARFALGAAALFGFMLRRRPAIAHFFLPASYLMGAPLALLAGIRIRVMSRRSLNDYQTGHPILKRLEALLHGRMTALLGNSRAVIRQLAEEGAPPSRLVLIYNGIDPALMRGKPCRARIREELGVSQEALLFICVANLIAYKGHADLIAALAAGGNRLPPEWYLLIVGRDDGIGPALREQAVTLGLSKHVIFLGARDDVADLLRGADVAVLASHQEGFANAVLEAMAVGLPVIATDVGGNSEALLDGENGFLVAPRQPHALAEAIVRLASDAKLRDRYGRAAQQRIVDRFTMDRCVEAYDCLYRTLLAGGKIADAKDSDAARCRLSRQW